MSDLFANLAVSFNDRTFGGRRSETAFFSQNMDLIDSHGVVLGGDVTPEPATMSMMVFGLVGLVGIAGMARRRRRKA